MTQSEWGDTVMSRDTAGGGQMNACLAGEWLGERGLRVITAASG
jgi:hypothetical protein